MNGTWQTSEKDNLGKKKTANDHIKCAAIDSFIVERCALEVFSVHVLQDIDFRSFVLSKIVVDVLKEMPLVSDSGGPAHLLFLCRCSPPSTLLSTAQKRTEAVETPVNVF